MGTGYPVVPLFETILAYKWEFLRLQRREEFEQEFEVPFTLLTLNMDEECYRYIKCYLMEQTKQDHAAVPDFDVGNHWNNVGIQGPGNSGESSILDCIRSIGEEKFGDVIKSPFEKENVPLAFPAALCIVKLRIVEAHKARLKNFEALRNTSMGASLCDSIKHVEDYYLGNDDEKKAFDEQEVMVKRYLRFTHEKNEFILVAIIDDFELQSLEQNIFIFEANEDVGDLFSRNEGFRALTERVDEARNVLDCTKKLFRAIPGLQKRIQNVVGGRSES